MAKLPFDQSHAFIIGNDSYQHISTLKNAVKDAKDIAELLRGSHNYQVHELYDGTQAQMEEMLQGMAALVKPQDRVIVYYAGHGIAIESEADPQGYLVPVDAEKSGTEKLVSMDLLRDALKELTCKHGLLILDCCFAGSFKWSTGFRFSFIRNAEEPLYEERFTQFVESPAWQVITSSAHDQKALDLIQHDSLGLRQLTAEQNSPFAKALKDAIREKTSHPGEREKGGDGVITATELYSLLRRKVEMEARKQETTQSPAFFTMSRHNSKGEYIFLEPGHKLNLDHVPDKNPYKGLQAYQLEEEDARTFFGRKTAIQSLAKKLDKTHTLIVTAPSGQGKSSTIMAGLFPYLMKSKGYLRDQILILRPGEKKLDVWQELRHLDVSQQQIVYVDQYEEIFTEAEDKREAFEQAMVTLYEKIHVYLKVKQAWPPLKIILSLRSDFEWKLQSSIVGEQFWSETRSQSFLYRLPPMDLDELYEAAAKPAWVIAYEFESTESEDLIDQILEDIHHAPGALPLLSFALSKLYQHRDHGNRLFTRKAYEDKLGGIKGALSKHADEIYGFGKIRQDQPKEEDDPIKWTQDHRIIMRKLILRMVRLNDGSYSRRKVYVEYKDDLLKRKGLNELNFPDHLDATIEQVIATLEGMDAQASISAAVGELNKRQQNQAAEEVLRVLKDTQVDDSYLNSSVEDIILTLKGRHMDTIVQEVIQVLEDTHLIRKDVDGVGIFVEPMHDSLINHWPRCLTWIEEFKRENLVLQRQVWQAVIEYHQWVPDVYSRPGDTAPLWDNNPKLQQIQLAITDPRDLWFCQKGWGEKSISSMAWLLWHQGDLSEEQKEDLQSYVWFFGREDGEDSYYEDMDSETVFEKIQDQMDAWLNEEELTFVRSSFREQRKEIERIKKQRDEAIAESKRTARLARANSNAVLALRTAKTEPTKALRLAEMNYHLYPESDTSSGILREILAEPGRGYCLRSIEKAHEARIMSIAVSPDGQSILSGSYDNTAKLWDLSGNPIQTFEGHTGGVLSVAFSADGKYVLTGSADETAMLWSLEGKALITFQGHQKRLMAVACSPQGHPLQVLTGSEDGTVRLYNARPTTGTAELKAVLEPNKSTISSLAFFPDGETVLLGTLNGVAQIWHTEESTPLVSFGDHRGQIDSVAISADGQQILTGSWDKTVKMWTWDKEQKTVKPGQTFEGHALPVSAVAFSPDGQKVLSGSADKSLKQWSLDGRELGRFVDHTEGVEALAYFPDGKKIVSGGSIDYAIKLWNAQSGLGESQEPEPMSYDENKNFVSAVAYSPRGNHILTAYWDHTAKLWDLSGKQIQSFDGHTDKLNAVAFSSDGQFVLTGSKDNTAKLWNLQGELLNTLPHQLPVQSVTFSPDGQYILTAGGEWETGEAKMWAVDLNGKSCQIQAVRSFEGHEGAISSAVFSPDGQLILTGCRDTTLKLWHKDQDQALMTYTGHSKAVKSVAFSPEGIHLLSGSADETVKYWHKDQQEALWTFSGHNRSVDAVAFSPDGQFILSGGEEQRARVLDISGKEVHSMSDRRSVVTSLAFSPDGKMALTGTEYNLINEWDLSDKDAKAKPRSFEAYRSSIHSVAFSRDKENICVGNWDHAVLFQGKNGETIQSFRGHTDKITAIAFSSDEQWMLTGSADKTAKLWAVDSGELISTFSGHSLTLTSVLFSPDDQSVVTGAGPDYYDRGEVKLWDLSGNEIQAFHGHRLGVRSLAFSADGQRLLSGAGNYSEGEAKLWTLDGQEIQTFDGDIKGVSSISFSSDGQYILVGCDDRKARLWDIHGREIQAVDSFAYGDLRFVFSSDEQEILALRLKNMQEEEVGRWLTPWALIHQQAQHYSIEDLRDWGLQYEEEDRETMLTSREEKLW